MPIKKFIAFLPIKIAFGTNNTGKVLGLTIPSETGIYKLTCNECNLLSTLIKRVDLLLNDLKNIYQEKTTKSKIELCT